MRYMAIETAIYHGKPKTPKCNLSNTRAVRRERLFRFTKLYNSVRTAAV